MKPRPQSSTHEVLYFSR